MTTELEFAYSFQYLRKRAVPEVEVCEAPERDWALQADAAAPAEDEMAPLEVSAGIAWEEIAVPTQPGGCCRFISTSTSSFPQFHDPKSCGS